MTLKQLMASYRVGEIDSDRVLETLQRQFGQDSATAQRTLQSFDRGVVPSAPEVTDDGQEIPPTDPMGYTGSSLIGQDMLGRERPARPAYTDRPTLPVLDDLSTTGTSLMGPSMLGGDTGSAPGTNLFSNLWGGFKDLRGGIRDQAGYENVMLPVLKQGLGQGLAGWGQLGKQVGSGLQDWGSNQLDFLKEPFEWAGGALQGAGKAYAGMTMDGARQLVNFFGQDDNDLSSEQIKARMQADVADRDEAINLLTRNIGMSRSDAINTVTGWESETLTNIPLKQAWGDQWRRFQEQIRAAPGQLFETVAESPGGQAVGGAVEFAQRLPGILDRPLAETFGGPSDRGAYTPGFGASPDQLLDVAGGGSPGFYQSRETISPTGKIFPAGDSAMDLQQQLESAQRYGKGFTPSVRPGTWTGDQLDPGTGLPLDTRSLVERAAANRGMLQQFGGDPAMGFDAFATPGARPSPTTPAASSAVDAISRNMVSPVPIGGSEFETLTTGGMEPVYPPAAPAVPGAPAAPSVPAAPAGPAGRVMDLPTGPNVYQGTTITGTPPPFERGDEFWQQAQQIPELYERFKLSQFPGASLGDIQSQAGQTFLKQGYRPAIGQFKLADAMGMTTGDSPEEKFANFMGQQDRLSLDQLRQGFGGLGNYLTAQAAAAAAGTDTTGAVDVGFQTAFKDLNEGNLIAAAQAALGGGSGTYGGLKGMYDIFQTQHGPTGGKKEFIDWVGTAIPGYGGRAPYVAGPTAAAAIPATPTYDPTVAATPAVPAAPIRSLAERTSVSPQMKIGFDTSKPFVPSTPSDVAGLTKLQTFTPEQQGYIQDLRPTSSDVIGLQAKANMIPGGGGYIGGGWSPEVTRNTYDALEDELLMGGNGLGMGAATNPLNVTNKPAATLFRKFLGR